MVAAPLRGDRAGAGRQEHLVAVEGAVADPNDGQGRHPERGRAPPAVGHRIGNALVQPGAPLQPRPDRLRVGVRPGGVGLHQLRVERLGRAERVEVGSELAVEPQPAVVVPGHGRPGRR